jgi:hypothetical protein
LSSRKPNLQNQVLSSNRNGLFHGSYSYINIYIYIYITRKWPISTCGWFSWYKRYCVACDRERSVQNSECFYRTQGKVAHCRRL